MLRSIRGQCQEHPFDAEVYGVAVVGGQRWRSAASAIHSISPDIEDALDLRRIDEGIEGQLGMLDAHRVTKHSPPEIGRM